MKNEFYSSVVPLIIFNGGFIAGYLIFLIIKKLTGKKDKDKKKAHSKLIWSSLQDYWFTITEPVVQLFIKMGITPNSITVFGVFISLFSAILFAQGNIGSAGWVMIAGGVFDLMDGRVARATNKVTKQGAFLDSVMDRYSDGLILGGLLIMFRDHWLVYFLIMSFIGFFCVSYTKARAEATGIKCDVGFFQRPERIFSLGLSAIFSPIFSYYTNIEVPFLLMGVIMILGIGTLLTSIYRIIYSFNKLS